MLESIFKRTFDFGNSTDILEIKISQSQFSRELGNSIWNFRSLRKFAERKKKKWCLGSRTQGSFLCGGGREEGKKWILTQINLELWKSATEKTDTAWYYFYMESKVQLIAAESRKVVARDGGDGGQGVVGKRGQTFNYKTSKDLTWQL